MNRKIRKKSIRSCSTGRVTGVAPYGWTSSYLLGPDELFAREGYIFVYQDVRGRYLSEGESKMCDLTSRIRRAPRLMKTSAPTITVDWADQEYSEQQRPVGVYGISYPGFYTSMAGIDSHPGGQSYFTAGARL